MKRSTIVALVIAGVLLVDQVVKVWVKLNMSVGDSFDILGLDWAKIYFIENPGMAFGITFGGVIGKFILSGFRIIMVAVLIYIMRQLIKSKESIGFLISFALIIAGAMGNIIDSVFYGLIFSASEYHGGVATFMPDGGGYAPLLQGKVVDMLYFPLIDSTFPDWFPVWGGERFQFFRPIFNIADSAISVGVAIIILFYRKFFTQKKEVTSPSVIGSEENTEVAVTS